MPSSFYAEMGSALRDERDYLTRGKGWWVQLPVRSGETVTVDVLATRPVDVFFLDRDGLDQYRAALDRGKGDVVTYWGRNWTQHYTRTFSPERGDEWWVLVDNTGFPNTGARSDGLSARVRVFGPKDEVAAAIARRPTTISSAPPDAFDGTWRGTTAQGQGVVLVVAGGVVTHVAMTVSASGKGATKRCTTTTTCPADKPCATVSPAAPVQQGTFSFVHARSHTFGLALRGTFTSTTSAFGELRFVMAAERDCPELAGMVPWTASRS